MQYDTEFHFDPPSQNRHAPRPGRAALRRRHVHVAPCNPSKLNYARCVAAAGREAGPDRLRREMLPDGRPGGLDTQLKELRSKSAHEWATARFFAATNAAATGGFVSTANAKRVARWRLAAKICVVVALLIWVAAAVVAAELLPRFALPFLVVAIGIWVGGMHLAGHRFGSSTNMSSTREELV